MTVKVGDFFSNLRTVEGGVPQGSLLGVFFFNVVVDCFEAYSGNVANYGPAVDDVLAPDPNAFGEDDPHIPPMLVRDHKHLPPFREELIRVAKYVDDIIMSERINFDKITTDGYTFRDFHATRSSNLFRHIVVRAVFCGMMVNSTKTNAMVIADTKSYIPTAHFYDA